MNKFIYIISFILSFCFMAIVAALVKTGFDFNYVFDDRSPVFFCVVILAIFLYITIPIYLLQIFIVTIGLIFRLFKEKQTVKYLLIPYGFICILRNYYKELK